MRVGEQGFEMIQNLNDLDRHNYGIKGGLVKKTSLVTKKAVILGTG
jgi:hypothetical protein